MDDTPTTGTGGAEAPEGGTAPKPVRPSRIGFAVRLRTYFFAGILVTAPISITFYLAWLFITVVDDWVRPFIPPAYNPENYLRFSLPGIGLVVVLVGLTFIGAVTANFLGRFFLRLSERILNRMPVIRSIYSAVKQIFETVLAQQSGAFREVVLIEYPRRGIWALGFITGTTQGEVQELTEDEMLNVFLPTTPNPTSGFLLFVPKGEVVRLSMSVEEGIKMVVSGGIVTPPDRRSPEARRVHIPARAADRLQS